MTRAEVRVRQEWSTRCRVPRHAPLVWEHTCIRSKAAFGPSHCRANGLGLKHDDVPLLEDKCTTSTDIQIPHINFPHEDLHIRSKEALKSSALFHVMVVAGCRRRHNSFEVRLNEYQESPAGAGVLALLTGFAVSFVRGLAAIAIRFGLATSSTYLKGC